MELIYKAVGAAVSSAVIVLLIKRQNPELSALMSICAVTVILISAVTFAAQLCELFRAVSDFTDVSGIYTACILKCLSISIVTKLGSEICRDAGQAALAGSVEFAGTVSAMTLLLPLLKNMLSLIGEMV